MALIVLIAIGVATLKIKLVQTKKLAYVLAGTR